MNPRNRDARRLRAVRRPHSLINTLSIRPSSKSNDDTSSFGAALVLFSSSKVPREMSTSGPGTLSSPTQKYECILAHLPTSTACLNLPAVGDKSSAKPCHAGLASPLVQAHKQQLLCLPHAASSPVGLGSGRILQLRGLGKGSIPGRVLRRGLLFCPSLPALHVLHDQ